MALGGADGGTIELSVDDARAIGLNRQLGNHVLVVTHRGTHLPLPVFLGQQLHGGTHVEALILQFAAIAPVGLQTREEAERLQGEQVVGGRTEVVDAQGEAVADEARLEADVKASGGFPLDLGVSNAAERKGRSLMQEIARAEIAAGCIEVDVVIAAHIEAGRQAQVVDTRHTGHPRLVADDPRSLDTGEHAPGHAAQLQTVGILTEARRT